MGKWRLIETWKPTSSAPHWPYLRALVCDDGVVMEADWKPGERPPGTGEWWPANTDSEYGSQIFPTHWMPIPEPPRSVKRGD